MQWRDAREHYPGQWLLIEAIQARSQDGHRILEDVAVIDSYPDSVAAWRRYRSLHRLAPDREMYVCHTARDTVEILERTWHGIRSA